MFNLDPRRRFRQLKGAVVYRFRSFWDFPPWVIVLVTAAVVGSISAVASVIALARWRNRDVRELRVPSWPANS